MAPNPDLLFRTLADPTRRGLFERLCREGNVEPARSAVLNCRAEGGAVKG